MSLESCGCLIVQIFRNLRSLMLDFWQGNLTGCPREPWHDLHSKIDGPAAYDVLKNFEERWLKASKVCGTKKLKASYDDALLKIDQIPEFLSLDDEPYLSDQDPEAWHVQVLNAISVRFFVQLTYQCMKHWP